MYFSRDFINLVRESLDIVTIIRNEGIDLPEKRHFYSIDLRTLCPFHEEETPSFSVVIDKQFWHCFGCGRGGDCFGFIQQFRGVNFPLSVKYLATRYGIPLPEGYNRKRRS